MRCLKTFAASTRVSRAREVRGRVPLSAEIPRIVGIVEKTANADRQIRSSPVRGRATGGTARGRGSRTRNETGKGSTDVPDETNRAAVYKMCRPGKAAASFSVVRCSTRPDCCAVPGALIGRTRILIFWERTLRL
jgi:hypothetical protein